MRSEPVHSMFIDLELSFGELSECIAFAGPDWCVRFANKALLRLLATTAEESLGKRAQDLFVGSDHYLRSAQRSGTDPGFKRSERTAHICQADGTLTPIEILCAAVSRTDGKLNGYMIVVRDISERVALQSQVNKLVTRLEDSLDALSEGFALYDKDDRLLACNENYRKIYRASAERMVPGTTFKEIIRFGLENGQYDTGDLTKEEWLNDRVARHQRADGEVIEQELGDGRWLRISERRTRSGGIAGIRSDITELKRAQAKAEDAYFDLSIIADSVSALIVEIDQEGTCLFANRIASEWLDAPSEGLIGSSLDTHLSAFSNRGTLLHIGKALAGKKSSVEIKLRTPDGNTRDCLVEFNPKQNALGEITSVVILANDITVRRNTERTQAKLYAITSTRELSHTEKIQQILELGCKHFSLPNGLIGRVQDESLFIEFAVADNREIVPGLSFPLLTTCCAKTIVSNGPVSTPNASMTGSPPHPSYGIAGAETYIGTKLIVDGSAYGTISFSSPEPRRKPFSMTDHQIIRQFADWIGNEIARQQDHDALLAAQEEMERAASIDDLTQILNRRAFFSKGQEEFDRYLRSGQTFSVVMVDLDHFKMINDQFGHRGGDRILRKFAEVVGRELRSSDTFGRIGGEEFCLLLFNTNAAQALEPCERLLEQIRQECVVDGLNCTVTCSIGLDEIRPGDKSISAAMQRADGALYTAKETGRNRIVRYQNPRAAARSA